MNLKNTEGKQENCSLYCKVGGVTLIMTESTKTASE